MGKKDVYTRPYFADKKRFADFVNVHLYGGREIVTGEGLKGLKGVYPSMGSVSGEKRRDVFMEQEKPRMRYGIELETESDHGMPERIMVYDGGEYEKQMGEWDKEHRERREYRDYIERKSRMKESDRLVPVISMVLYLGEGKWKGPRRLKEMMEVPKEIEERSGDYLQDYRICVVEADYVDAEAYRTELAIAVNLNLRPVIKKMEEEEKDMCRAFEELMMEQEEIGIEKGKSEGVRVLIETCKELGASREDTESRIVLKLALSEDEAKGYVEQYWN